ncbi:MAG: hypothetical protein ACD_39C01218G0004 [uncultured bacterium]|nr:MAG: hypothetical protein ACD_39C01218G0004 [uncultured bacterium]
MAVEAKCGRAKISSGLVWFCEKYNFKGVQVVKDLKREQTVGRIDLVDAERFLKELYI